MKLPILINRIIIDVKIVNSKRLRRTKIPSNLTIAAAIEIIQKSGNESNLIDFEMIKT